MNSSIKNKENSTLDRQKQDEVLIFTIVFQIALLASKNMFVTTFQAAYNFNTYFNTIIFVIMGFLYIRCFIITRFRIKFVSFYIVFLSAAFLTATFAFNKNLFGYYYVLSSLEIFIVYCIPLILFVPLIHDIDKLLEYFYFASNFMAITAIICFVLIVAGTETLRDYSMSFGKAAMIPSIFLFSKAFRKGSIRDYILAILCTMTIFLLGSRWPLLCIGVFLIYGITNKLYSNKKTFIPAFLAVISIAILIYINYMEILVGLNVIFSKMGVSSRTLTYLLNDSIAYDSGRSEIHAELLLKLKESPLFGYGAFGGNVTVGLPHSFVLDTWANFGFLFGSIILIYSIYMTIYRYRINRSTSYGELVVIYACMIWPKITIGESFWSSDKYWMLMSLIILGRYIKQNVNRKNEE